VRTNDGTMLGIIQSLVDITGNSNDGSFAGVNRDLVTSIGILRVGRILHQDSLTADNQSRDADIDRRTC